MNSFTRSTVSCLLMAALLTLAVPPLPRSEAAAAPASQQSRMERWRRRGEHQNRWRLKSGTGKVKTGPEVASRVRKLKEEYGGVRAAFRAFERKGRTPKIDDAMAVAGQFTLPTEGGESASVKGAGGLFRKASFSRQDQTVVSDSTFELILVPAVETPDEWQGSAICTMYDGYGNIQAQFTANIVSVPNSESNPMIVFEARYGSDTPMYFAHEPGMFTGFHFGTLIRDHQSLYGEPPPLNIEDWQFISDEQRDYYYGMYPEQQSYDSGDGPAPVLQMARRGGAVFRQARFQVRSDRNWNRGQLQPCNAMDGRGVQMVPAGTCGPGGFPVPPTVTRYFVFVAAGCSAMTFCRADPRCRLATCGGAALSNLPVLFGF